MSRLEQALFPSGFVKALPLLKCCKKWDVYCMANCVSSKNCGACGVLPNPSHLLYFPQSPHSLQHGALRCLPLSISLPSSWPKPPPSTAIHRHHAPRPLPSPASGCSARLRTISRVITNQFTSLPRSYSAAALHLI